MSTKRIKVGGGKGKKLRTDGRKLLNKIHTRENKIRRITKSLVYATGRGKEQLEERLNYWQTQN